MRRTTDLRAFPTLSKRNFRFFDADKGGSNQTAISSSDQITFGSINTNIGGTFASSVCTVDIPGIWMFNVGISVTGFSGDVTDYIEPTIRKNGSGARTEFFRGGGNTAWAAQFLYFANAVKGDTFDVILTFGDDATCTVDGSTTYTWFQGALFVPGIS